MTLLATTCRFPGFTIDQRRSEKAAKEEQRRANLQAGEKPRTPLAFSGE